MEEDATSVESIALAIAVASNKELRTRSDELLAKLMTAARTLTVLNGKIAQSFGGRPAA